jgi:hypothetical protein
MVILFHLIEYLLIVRYKVVDNVDKTYKVISTFTEDAGKYERTSNRPLILIVIPVLETFHNMRSSVELS